MSLSFATNALLSAALVVTVWGAANTAPQEPRVVEFSTTTTPNYTEAEQKVEQQQSDLTEGRVCYDDPTDHQPTFAVVKDDGGTTAYRLTADQAWTASHAGSVWVLAWCD